MFWAASALRRELHRDLGGPRLTLRVLSSQGPCQPNTVTREASRCFTGGRFFLVFTSFVLQLNLKEFSGVSKLAKM